MRSACPIAPVPLDRWPAFLVALGLAFPGLGNAAALPSPPSVSEVQPLLAKLCFDCHGADTQKGDIRLDQLSADPSDRGQTELLHDALDQLNLGEMPPPKKPQPTDAERTRLVEWMTESLRHAAKAQRFRQGRVLSRRLARYEYENTLRDLLGVDLHFAENLPPDPPSPQGFLNDGATLEMTPSQLETYLTAARRALEVAIVSGERPELHRHRITETDRGKLPTRKVAGHVPVNPEFALDVASFPREGEFRVRVTAGVRLPEGHDFPRLRLSLGCVPGIIHVPRKPIGEVDVTAPAGEPQTFVFRGRVEDFPQPGDVPFKNLDFQGMILLIDFLDADGKELRDPGRRYVRPPPKKKKKGKKPAPLPEPAPPGTLPEIVIHEVEFAAPVFAQWPPESHQRLMQPRRRFPEEAVRARELLASFLPRAFRRPVRSPELDTYEALFRKLRPQFDGFTETMRECFAAVLISPEFLYLVEDQSQGAATGEPERRTAHELASRLSYFLWSTMPDEELFERARSGRLQDPEVLAGQVHRMLDDPRSSEFLTRFADQWLDLGALDRVAVNPEVFAGFEESLKTAMREETRAVFAALVRSDLSLLTLLDSDWTLLNRALARHYGVDGPRTSRFEYVSLPPTSPHGGLLGQAAFHLANSDGAHSHPIKRAVWILDRLLDSPPAPPPPDVPELDPASPSLAGLSLREQLAVHRRKEACGNCHRGIDPWGIPLEQFNAIGQWKPAAAETATTLPSGVRVDDAEGLKQYLLRERRPWFARSAVKRLISYALGRSLDLGDQAAVDELTRRFEADGYRLRPLLIDLAQSDLFRFK